MKKTTILFLLNMDDRKILLAMKKRGFGVGKWNGVGGKVQEGESIEDAVIREAKEEIGVDIFKNNLEKVALLQFSFLEKEDWNQETHVYITKTWNGIPEETEEMKPQWYSYDDIPYKEMWIDDILWLPKVLNNKKIEAEFHFNNDGSVIQKSEVKEIDYL